MIEGHIPVTVARYLKVKAVNYGRLPIPGIRAQVIRRSSR